MKTTKAERPAPTAADWEVITSGEIRRDDVLSLDLDAWEALVHRGERNGGMVALAPEDIDWHGVYADRCVVLTTPWSPTPGRVELTYRRWWTTVTDTAEADAPCLRLRPACEPGAEYCPRHGYSRCDAR